MAILNFGSINIDRSFQLDALPRPGETIAARSESVGLGGKGANQSIAIARMGGSVRHLGSVARGDAWIIQVLRNAGVDTQNVHLRDDQATGQAIVMVANDGENSILLSAGANATFTDDEIASAIDAMAPGDWLLIQNETNGTATAARLASARGLKVALAAAPFDPVAVLPILPFTDLLALNEVEDDQLRVADHQGLATRPGLARLVTAGSRGAMYTSIGVEEAVTAVPVSAVDTTAAGDTFLGAFLAFLDCGEGSIKSALSLASAAAALKVTRSGAADAIPTRAEVAVFLRSVHAPVGISS